MPKLPVNGATLHYESAGSGPETIVFAHGLLWSGEMFAAQVAAFAPRFRCISFDFRGQGRSEVTRGGYDMETLTQDAAALIEGLELGCVHFAGVSMGGFVAMRLAARRPDLLRSAIFIGTSADAESKEKAGRYRLLGLVARWLGYGLVAARVMPIMFGKTFIADPARAAERTYWRTRLERNDRIGIQRALAGVIERAPIFDELRNIGIPVLVLVGAEDEATVPAKAQRIAGAIAGAELVVIPRAGHSSPVEEPAAINAAILAFLDRVIGAGA